MTERKSGGGGGGGDEDDDDDDDRIKKYTHIHLNSSMEPKQVYHPYNPEILKSFFSFSSSQCPQLNPLIAFSSPL